MTEPSTREDLMERGLVGIGPVYSAELTSPTTSATLTENQTEKKLPAERERKLDIKRWWRNWRAGEGEMEPPELPVIVKSLDKTPQGYPRLALLLDSDESFMFYRRFGYLQTRLLLYKQDELRELEENLEDLDKNETDWTLLCSRVRDEESSGKRQTLMVNIDQKYKEYVALLVASREIASFDPPIPRDYFTLKKYFDIAKPLCLEESYIYHQGDILSLKPSRDYTMLDSFIQIMFDGFPKALKKASRSLLRIVIQVARNTRGNRKADPSNGFMIYSTQRYDVIVTSIVLILITFLLIIPVYIIWRLTRNTQATNSISPIIGVMLSFTVVFSLVLLKFTKAKRHEILAAAAAYCAVLVTFMGNVGQVSQNGPTSP
ncbi:hypothetical protein BDZ45DRAFT_744736 [Acephala macrosclerotiorum]|nr:hypothetical protein BDZ45DRAFT_744736 [Acephala macrosclerotiorum]